VSAPQSSRAETQSSRAVQPSSRPVNCGEYERLAEGLTDPAAWGFLSGGAEDESTLRANRGAFGRWTFRPRVLVDVSAVTTATTVLGLPVSLPVLLAPVALHRLYHPDGELATARAAAAEQTVLCVSTMTTHTHQEIADAAPGLHHWTQLYVLSDEGATRAHLAEAVAAGSSAIVLTVDTPVIGRRERDLRLGFNVPADLPLPYVSGAVGAVSRSQSKHSGLPLFSPSVTWRDLEWIADATKLPVLLKGILTREDALLAVEHGAAGVIVSNHGGRQLEGAPATLDALAEVAEAAAGRVEVLLDGGIRRGGDAVKALALGAQAVLVGRPPMWGLAADGEAGVRHVLALLRDEVALTLALLGCTSPDQVRRTHVQPAVPYDRPA
jgi:isopentenyl diphosphate isomerase/L-lactate dehydrogenase-like FMN-dependent dehydrogenase